MRVIVIFLCLLPSAVFAGFWGPSNFWECILEEMPGTKNDPVAVEVVKECRREFPTNEGVEKEQSMFGVQTAGECVLKYGDNVASPRGAKYLMIACYKLYPSE